MPGGAELSEKLPDEIFQLVESFKKFVREQKAFRDQKFDIEPMLEIDKDADDFMLAFQRVAVDSDINKQLIQQIRDETTKLLRHAELAYSLLRSHITNNPSQQNQQQPQQQQHQQQQQHNNTMSSLFGATFLNPNTTNTNLQQPQQNQTSQFNASGINLPSNNLTNLNNQQNDSVNQTSNHHQFASTTSSQYFVELADQFEVRMKAYGEQIKDLKMSLDSVIKTYNADELFRWLKKQHETLGEIAAKVYMTHERILEKKSELDKNMAMENLA